MLSLLELTEKLIPKPNRFTKDIDKKRIELNIERSKFSNGPARKIIVSKLNQLKKESTNGY